MTTRYQLPHPLALALLAISMLALTLATAVEADSSTPGKITPVRERELAHFVRHDCGSCHGLTLRGGLGPPLTPEALRGKPVEYIKAMILDSRPGTAMPPWRPLLPEAEAAWIAENLLLGMPDAR